MQQKLIEFTKDDNNIIMAYNINTLNFTKFYSCYMSLKNVPVHTWPKIDDDCLVMLVRSSGVVLAPKPTHVNSDVLKNALKSYLKPRVKNCLTNLSLMKEEYHVVIVRCQCLKTVLQPI